MAAAVILGPTAGGISCGSAARIGASRYWLYIAALRPVPAAVAGSYFNVIPVFGVTFAFLFLGERLTTIQWVGAAVILVSVIELVRLTRRDGGEGVTA